MPDPAAHLAAVGDIVDGLRRLGSQPVLVGGMALVVLGSRRVTQNFDFVISSSVVTTARSHSAPKS